MGNSERFNPLFILACYAVSILLLPVSIIIIFLSFILKNIVRIYLKIKYGKKYVGMLNGLDGLWILTTNEKMAIDVILIFRAKTIDSGIAIKQMINTITKKVLAYPEKYPKYTSTVHAFCSYGYLLKAEYGSPEELITVIKADKNSKSLSQIFSDTSNDPFPINNTFLCNLVAIDGSPEWKHQNNLNEYQFPVQLRCHHAIGDAISIIANTVNIFVDEKVDIITIVEEKLKNKDVIRQLTAFKYIIFLLHMLILAPGYLLLMKMCNLIPSTKRCEATMMGGRRDIVFDVDNDSLEIVSRIKNVIGDTTFMEVMMTVVSASMQQYYEDSNLPVPDETAVFLPVILPVPTKNSNEITGNVTLHRLPTPIYRSSSSLLERLKAVKSLSRPTKAGPDARVRYFLWNFLSGLLPVEFIPLMENLSYATICFSNVPGFPKVTACKDLDVDHIYGAPPTIGYIGISGSFFTYGDKLHIGISLDRNIISPGEPGDKILRNIFENIRKMDAELSKKQ